MRSILVGQSLALTLSNKISTITLIYICLEIIGPFSQGIVLLHYMRNTFPCIYLPLTSADWFFLGGFAYLA